MKLSDQLIVSNPDRESEWRQILERHLKEPGLYVLSIPKDRDYPAEILSSKEYYKKESSCEVIGIADSSGAAVQLLVSTIQRVLSEDPQLHQLKRKLREIYL